MHQRSPVPNAFLATLLVVAALLSGCGTDGTDTARPPTGVRVLTTAQLGSALIRESDLGGAFVDSGPSDDKGTDMGCLNALSHFADTVHAVHEIDANLKPSSGLPAIDQTIGSFHTSAEAQSVINRFRSSVARCPSTDASSDGVRMHIELRANGHRTGSGVDGQLNIYGTGTAAYRNLRFPMRMRITLFRIDNHLDMVSFTDVRANLGTAPDKLVKLAHRRLAAVIAGKPVPRSRSLRLEPTSITAASSGSA
jgi:hypothetical protein